MMFDPLYLLFALPGLLLSMFASFYVKSTFGKYSKVGTYSGMTGAQAAERMLTSAGITDVRIERVNGFLSDHYDPSAKTLRLSPDVYGSQSVSAIGVACHEAGHAIQHATHYSPLWLRSVLVLPANLGSNFSYILIAAGAFMQSPSLINIGLLLFSLAVLFTIVTLPVEWDASARAKKAILSAGFVSAQEHQAACSVLNAAFLTYVAAAASAVMTLLYYLVRLGIIGGRRRD
ncbi:MAG: zinc metallopeptidase [Victivallales bacterium]|nr:zinc metallopeptidase [Victivallales bacterium]